MHPAFLNVEASLTGRRWIGPDAGQDRLAEAIAQGSRLPLPLCRILAARGVEPAEAAAFLAPVLRDLLPDPRSLRDMEKAASRFLQAVDNRERVAIFADYDVDGGASAALLIVWLRAMGRQATLYIPDRIDEGYGPNTPAMRDLAKTHSLILCVDCGTLSHDPVAAAAPADVVILDHHLAAETLPAAHAIVNPNRQDEDGQLAHLCAAAVVFLLLVEANRQLRADGTQGPDLMQMLDLVALATVADVAPLTGVNRAFVRQGLKVMARRGNTGLAALMDAARLTKPPTASDMGFALGPRINAGGRVGKSDLGVRLLTTSDPQEAADISQELNRLNEERRAIEAGVLDEAMTASTACGNAPVAIVAGQGWHPGVIGIVAGRLKERLHRPAIVIALDEAGVGKGSGRSISGVDLGAAILAAKESGLLVAGGGHAMAAGLTVEADKVDALGAFLNDRLAADVERASGDKALLIDAVLAPRGISPLWCDAIESAGPYGAGWPAPRVATGPVRIVEAGIVGTDHVRLIVAGDDGGRFKAVAFRSAETELGQTLLHGRAGRKLWLAGRAKRDDWGSRPAAELHVEDAAWAD